MHASSSILSDRCHASLSALCQGRISSFHDPRPTPAAFARDELPQNVYSPNTADTTPYGVARAAVVGCIDSTLFSSFQHKSRASDNDTEHAMLTVQGHAVLVPARLQLRLSTKAAALGLQCTSITWPRISQLVLIHMGARPGMLRRSETRPEQEACCGPPFS